MEGYRVPFLPNVDFRLLFNSPISLLSHKLTKEITENASYIETCVSLVQYINENVYLFPINVVQCFFPLWIIPGRYSANATAFCSYVLLMYACSEIVVH